MSQVHELLEMLKSQIRASGVTYRDLSDKIGVSESTLKRWFSQKSFNIERLDDICRVLKVDLVDLLRQGDRQHRVVSLDENQELELAADRNLFMTFYLALEGASPAKIAKKVSVPENKIQGHLIRLDQLGLIELHPHNRIVPLVPKSVRWLPEGPLNKKYGELIRRDFMDSSFDGELEKLWLESGFVSRSSLDVFSRKFDKLLAEFRDLIELDERSDAADKVNITFVAAHRPWVLPIYRKDGE